MHLLISENNLSLFLFYIPNEELYINVEES